MELDVVDPIWGNVGNTDGGGTGGTKVTDVLRPIWDDGNGKGNEARGEEVDVTVDDAELCCWDWDWIWHIFKWFLKQLVLWKYLPQDWHLVGIDCVLNTKKHAWQEFSLLIGSLT